MTGEPVPFWHWLEREDRSIVISPVRRKWLSTYYTLFAQLIDLATMLIGTMQPIAESCQYWGYGQFDQRIKKGHGVPRRQKSIGEAD